MPADFPSHSSASIVSEMVQRVPTFASAPHTRSIDAGPAAVSITTSRPERPTTSPDSQAEVRSASSSESQRGMGAERGLEVKQWLWALAIVCVLVLMY